MLLNRLNHAVLSIGNYWKRSRLPVVTVLGSCRQDSLEQIFRVTPIKKGLTYPHYANEVLQLVRFLNGKKKRFASPYVFRNDSIGSRKISKRVARRAFKKSKVIVIEIASRWEYLHKGDYIHHVAYDAPNLLPPSIRNPQEINSIIRRKQTYPELREVLESLSEELKDRTIVFVTNISTRKGSEREELNTFIESFAIEKGLGFLNPSELLQDYEVEEICKIEPVISHFTELGHDLIGSRLRTVILEQWANDHGRDLSLTQTYLSGESNKNGHGFGDYLFGSLKVFEMAWQAGLIPRTDTSRHGISQHLYHKSLKSDLPVRNIYHEDSDQGLTLSGSVFTNKRPLMPVSPPALDWLRSEAFRPKPELLEALMRSLSEFSLAPKAYFAVHVRMGDDDLVLGNKDEERISKVLRIIARVRSGLNSSAEMLILSDSKHLIEECSRQGLKSFKSNPVHLGDGRNSPQQVFGTLLEFLILAKAGHIIQISNYDWGSGFSEIAAIYGGAGLSKISISESS